MLTQKVVIGLYMMWLYLEKQLLLGPPQMMTWERTVGLYFFVGYYNGTWEEVQKRTLKDGQAGDWFVVSVAISGDTVVIGAVHDDEWGINSISGYVYTNIIWKWIQNDNIFSEECAAYEYSGYSVAILESTALFGAPDTWEVENGGSAYVVNLFVLC